ncbi:hypothetical protein ABI59_00850 [Acidobacteria bacterium Mor1]|nr:hypothetical protein ABI59_00850 [Acidobacteria bacterium Mor1]
MILILSVFAAGATLAATADDAWMEGIAGGWAGEDNMTPMGRMPFAMVFEAEEDGSFHAFSPFNSETWIDLKFYKGEDGRWLLDESAGMEGLGVQKHTLIPVDGPGEVRRWIYEENPEYLTVDVAQADGKMMMQVMLRGREHVQFNLARMSDAETEQMREEIKIAAKRTPEDMPFHTVAGEPNPDPAIRSARAAIAAHPEAAQPRVDLAAALLDAMQEDPAKAPLYAGEVLRELRTAVELDDKHAGAWTYLAGYYLNAPPIAGGSLEKAADAAERAVALDSQAAEGMLAEIRRRAGS